MFDSNGITLRRLWIAWFVVSGIVGVHFLAASGGKSVLGTLLLGQALGLLWFTERQWEAPARLQPFLERLAPSRRRILFGFAVSLIIAATGLATLAEKQKNSSFYDLAVLIWLAGIVLIAQLYVQLSSATVRQWWQTYRREIIVVAGLTLVAAVLRFYQLGQIPKTIEGDEAWTGLAALKLLPVAPALYDHPFSFFEGFGRIHLRLFRLALYVFGQNTFGLRLIPAIGGTVAIPATYLFARRLMGTRGAFVAASLLAVSHAHMHFSRTSAVGYIQSTWFSPLELYFFLSGLEQRSRARMVVGGLLLGLHFNFYYSAQMIAGFLIVYLLVAAIFARSFLRGNWANIAYFFGVALLIALPSIVWSFQHPDLFSARWIKEGTFQSGWLAREVANTGRPVALILWGRFQHAFLTIFALPFEDFYWALSPILDFITATLFLIGLLWALSNTRQPRVLLLNGWFWSGLMAVSLFAIPPSADSYRLLVVLPAMCVLAALGWEYLAGLAGNLPSAENSAFPRWTFAVMLVIASLNVKTYYLDFSGKCRYMVGNSVGRAWSLIGDYLREQHHSVDRAYLLGNEYYFYGTHPSVDFLSGGIPMTNIQEPFTGVDARGALLFVVIPDRQHELAALQAFAPGGEITRVADCNDLRFIGYRVDHY